MRILLVVIAGVTLIFDGFLFRNPDKTTLFNYLFNLVYAVIFILGMHIAFLRADKFIDRPNLQKSMRFFGGALFFFGAGLITWTFYNLILKVSIPYPSLADVSFLFYYPAAIAGIYFLIKSFGGEITKKLIIEGLLIFLIFFGSIYLFLNQSSLGSDVPFWARFFNVVYPMADSLLVAFAITILRTEKGISTHPNILYFVFGFLILAAADTIFSYRSSMGTYWNGDISDTLFALSGFLTAWGLLSIPNISLNDHTVS